MNFCLLAHFLTFYMTDFGTCCSMSFSRSMHGLQNNNNLHDSERITALRLYMSLSRTNFRPILARPEAAVLNRSEKGEKLSQTTPALSWLLPGHLHATTGLKGL